MNRYNRNDPSEADATGEIISWVIVIIMMFAFLPIGLLLLFRKLRNYAKQDRDTASRSDWHNTGSARQGARDAGTSHQAAHNAGASRQATHNAGTTRQTNRDTGASRQTNRDTGADAHNAGAKRQADHNAWATHHAANDAGSVRQAARDAGDAVREAGVAARQAAKQYVDYAKHSISSAYGDTARDFSTHKKKKSKKKKDRTLLDKKNGKFVSVLLLLISIPLFILGAAGIASAAQGFLSGGLNYWTDLFMGVFFLTGAFISFFSRNIRVRRFARYKNYYAFAVGRGILSVHDLARAAGVSARTVKRDLQAMISDGYFGCDAYFDYELNRLVLSPEAEKATRQAAADSAQTPPPTPAEAPTNPYMAIIMELRELNVSIADVPISKKIDRIEEITAKIFRIVEEHPEKQPQIRRFMNYYLPTTLKLLRSYATLEKQGIKGENITSAKENIGRILDTLATGFEQQLDQLFRSDAIDIAADINVLENLMHQDGLTGDRPEMKVMESST